MRYENGRVPDLADDATFLGPVRYTDIGDIMLTGGRDPGCSCRERPTDSVELPGRWRMRWKVRSDEDGETA